MDEEYKPKREFLANKKFLVILWGSVFLLFVMLLNLLSHVPDLLQSSYLNQMINPGDGTDAADIQTKAVDGFFKVSLVGLFRLRNFIFPSLRYPILLIPYLAILAFIGWKVFWKAYNMRRAFESLNHGAKGTARFAKIEELVQDSVAVPVNGQDYEGQSGIPQIHLTKTAMHKYNPHVVPFTKIRETQARTMRMPRIAQSTAERALRVVKKAAGAESLQGDYRSFPDDDDFKWGVDLVDTENKNAAIDAGTQSGKTQIFTYRVLDYIMRASIKDSIIIPDVKGDMVRNTKAEFEAHGYDVKVLNLVTTEYSIAYNPLELVKQAYWKGDYDNAAKLANTFSFSLFHNPNAKEPMWEEASIALVNALILAVCMVCKKRDTPERVTMYTLSLMLNELGANPDENGDTALDRFFASMSPTEPAKLQYGTINFSQGITRSGIYTGTMGKLKDYLLSDVGKMTAQNDIDFKDLAFGDTPIALFIVYPDYDDSYGTLVATLISQAMYVLSKEATLSADSKLPRRVKVIGEEIANIAAIDGLSRYMNVGVGRGILVYLIFQSIAQLEDKYGKDVAKALLSACGYKYDVFADDKDDANYFSALLGKKTIIAPSRHGAPMDVDKSFGESQDSRDLMTPDELSRMMEGEWVVIRNKQRHSLDGTKIVPWPIHATLEDGTEMPFTYEYLRNRFYHPQTFEELANGKKSPHANIDLEDLQLKIEVRVTPPQVEGENPTTTILVDGQQMDLTSSEVEHVERHARFDAAARRAAGQEPRGQESESEPATNAPATSPSEPEDGHEESPEEAAKRKRAAFNDFLRGRLDTEVSFDDDDFRDPTVVYPIKEVLTQSQIKALEAIIQDTTSSEWRYYCEITSMQQLVNWINEHQGQEFYRRTQFVIKRFEEYKKEEGDK